MSKNFTNTLLFFTVTLSLIMSGCGSGGSSDAQLVSTPSQSKVFGVASLDSTATSTVSVKDSSVPPQEKTAALSSNGSYTADVNGLKAPFILKASGIDQTGDHHVLYSVSTNGGRANINQISDTAVAVAAEGHDADRDMLYSQSERDENRRTANRFDEVINSLRTVLAPLFALYNISGNPVSDEDGGEHDGEHDDSGLSALLRDVRFKVTNGNVLVTNRETGDIIFSGPLTDLASGTIYPENMPAGPGGSTACIYTYSDWDVCQSDSTQIRTMLTSSPEGCTGTPVLSQACTPTPSACTYNYSGWGACLSNGTQTRTVLQSSPAGCTGTPVLSQSCTYVPPVTACTTFTYSAWGTCQSNGTQTRAVATSSPSGCTGGTPVLSQSCTYVPPTCTSFTYSAWGTCSNGTQSRTVATSSPTDCTGGTPVLSQSCTSTCTSFTYSAWGTCQSNNTQTRTVASSSPSGCTGGTPVLSQSCTYVPPVTPCTSFTYSAWGTCQSNNTQSRTVATSSPSGCTGGTPVLSQSCTYVPPTCTSFTYSAWGTCQSNNTQTRTVATSSPSGCTGGTPVLSQSCTYVPPSCTSFTYSAWGTCQSNNTQTRTVATSSPSGCTGGTPVLSQSCTYIPPTPVCGSCHAIPPSTGKHSFHTSRGIGCSTCHGTGYSATTVNATTHNNGVKNTVSSLNFSAGTCGSPGCHGSKSW